MVDKGEKKCIFLLLLSINELLTSFFLRDIESLLYSSSIRFLCRHSYHSQCLVQ